MAKFNSDIDIDFADKDLAALSLLKCTPASIKKGNKLTKHGSGLYVTDIPVDPISGAASIEYKAAEDRGYLKLDFLNMSLYSQVRNEEHLIELMHREPQWYELYDPDFLKQLVHIGNHYKSLIAMPEAVNSIPRLAMFLSVIRPAKKHLIGLKWKDVAKEVWVPPADGQYYFKKSHAISYSHLVVVNMNLLST